MPSEYFSASILPFRVNDASGASTAFVASIDEEFSKDNLSRIISWVTDATQGLPNEFCFLFTQYNESSDAAAVREAILECRDQLGTAKVNVYGTKNDYRSMMNEGQ